MRGLRKFERFGSVFQRQPGRLMRAQMFALAVLLGSCEVCVRGHSVHLRRFVAGIIHRLI